MKTAEKLDNTMDVQNDVNSQGATPSHALILPLFALMPTSHQQRVFQPPPEGH